MRKLTSFTNVSLDGYFTDSHGDMSWAHAVPQDKEWTDFVASNARSGGVLMFGRVTYDLMASFWPTPQATATMPQIAERMNNLPKLVVSRSLRDPSWQNTTAIGADLPTEIRQLKQQPGDDIAILGSGSIVAQLAQHRLIDEIQLVIVPIILGNGKKLFENVSGRLPLKQTATRAFSNGNVVLCYAPG